MPGTVLSMQNIYLVKKNYANPLEEDTKPPEGDNSMKFVYHQLNGKDSDEKILSEVNDITEKSDGKIEVDYVPHTLNDDFGRFSKKQKISEAKQSSVPKEKFVDVGLAKNCKWQKLYGPKQCFKCGLIYSSAHEHSKYCKSVVSKNNIPT